MNAIIRELKNYEQKHFEECKYIWQHFVPQRGQSDYLQGELLRQVEKLRNEACDNGNMNWDDNFEWFCDFLKKTLIDSKLFIEKDEKRIDTILTFLKENPEFPYTQNDVYDYLADAVGTFYLAHKEPIPYEKKAHIYR